MDRKQLSIRTIATIEASNNTADTFFSQIPSVSDIARVWSIDGIMDAIHNCSRILADLKAAEIDLAGSSEPGDGKRKAIAVHLQAKLDRNYRALRLKVNV